MTEITGRVFPFSSSEQSEAEGNQRVTQGLAVFPGPFFCSVKTQNYGYQVATFRSSDNLRIWCFRVKSDFEKLATFVEIIVEDVWWERCKFVQDDKIDEGRS